MITWSISTKPCLIITWDGVVFNGEHHYVDHIYYMIHVQPFGLQYSEAISVYARLVKFNPSILHVQNWLAPVVCERIPIITWCLGTTNCSNGAYSGKALIPWNFSKGSTNKATVVLRKIRCIKINITCNKNMWHDMAIIILCFWSPSPKHRHNLHRQRHETMISIILSSRGCLANYCFYNYC